MADHTEDALIREVNDELREEQMKKLWQRFGGYVVAVAVLVVVIVAGYQGWNHYIASARMEEGERFHAAISQLQSGDADGAAKAFAQLSADASTGYGVLARFQEAALLNEKSDAQGAGALYVQIAKDNASDPVLSGLANVLGAMAEINAGGYDKAGMELRLTAIAGDDQPYRFSARELLGLIALQSGDTDKARTVFAQLADDATAPRATAQRARDIAQSLGAK